MNHCEMVWSTAGTNRVCGRCLSLKDTVVGRSRCRCVIVYRESSKSRDTPTIGGNSITQPQTLTARQRIIRDAEDRAFRAPTGAISDYLTNGEQAALLSREIWRVLKEELAKMTWAPGTFELEKFTFEEFERYGLFDDLGELIGVKDDAPPEFKEAYEHDKKKRAEFEALGID